MTEHTRALQGAIDRAKGTASTMRGAAHEIRTLEAKAYRGKFVAEELLLSAKAAELEASAVSWDAKAAEIEAVMALVSK